MESDVRVRPAVDLLRPYLSESRLNTVPFGLRASSSSVGDVRGYLGIPEFNVSVSVPYATNYKVVDGNEEFCVDLQSALAMAIIGKDLRPVASGCDNLSSCSYDGHSLRWKWNGSKFSITIDGHDELVYSDEDFYLYGDYQSCIAQQLVFNGLRSVSATVAALEYMKAGSNATTIYTDSIMPEILTEWLQGHYVNVVRMAGAALHSIIEAANASSDSFYSILFVGANRPSIKPQSINFESDRVLFLVEIAAYGRFTKDDSAVVDGLNLAASKSRRLPPASVSDCWQRCDNIQFETVDCFHADSLTVLRSYGSAFGMILRVDAINHKSPVAGVVESYGSTCDARKFIFQYPTSFDPVLKERFNGNFLGKDGKWPVGTGFSDEHVFDCLPTDTFMGSNDIEGTVYVIYPPLNIMLFELCRMSGAGGYCTSAKSYWDSFSKFYQKVEAGSFNLDNVRVVFMPLQQVLNPEVNDDIDSVPSLLTELISNRSWGSWLASYKFMASQTYTFDLECDLPLSLKDYVLARGYSPESYLSNMLQCYKAMSLADNGFYLAQHIVQEFRVGFEVARSIASAYNSDGHLGSPYCGEKDAYLSGSKICSTGDFSQPQELSIDFKIDDMPTGGATRFAAQIPARSLSSIVEIFKVLSGDLVLNFGTGYGKTTASARLPFDPTYADEQFSVLKNNGVVVYICITAQQRKAVVSVLNYYKAKHTTNFDEVFSVPTAYLLDAAAFAAFSAKHIKSGELLSRLRFVIVDEADSVSSVTVDLAKSLITASNQQGSGAQRVLMTGTPAVPNGSDFILNDFTHMVPSPVFDFDLRVQNIDPENRQMIETSSDISEKTAKIKTYLQSHSYLKSVGGLIFVDTYWEGGHVYGELHGIGYNVCFATRDDTSNIAERQFVSGKANLMIVTNRYRRASGLGGICVGYVIDLGSPSIADLIQAKGRALRSAEFRKKLPPQMNAKALWLLVGPKTQYQTAPLFLREEDTYDQVELMLIGFRGCSIDFVIQHACGLNLSVPILKQTFNRMCDRKVAGTVRLGDQNVLAFHSLAIRDVYSKRAESQPLVSSKSPKFVGEPPIHPSPPYTGGTKDAAYTQVRVDPLAVSDVHEFGVPALVVSISDAFRSVSAGRVLTVEDPSWGTNVGAVKVLRIKCEIWFNHKKLTGIGMISHSDNPPFVEGAVVMVCIAKGRIYPNSCNLADICAFDTSLYVNTTAASISYRVLFDQHHYLVHQRLGSSFSVVVECGGAAPAIDASPQAEGSIVLPIRKVVKNVVKTLTFDRYEHPDSGKFNLNGEIFIVVSKKGSKALQLDEAQFPEFCSFLELKYSLVAFKGHQFLLIGTTKDRPYLCGYISENYDELIGVDPVKAPVEWRLAYDLDSCILPPVPYATCNWCFLLNLRNVSTFYVSSAQKFAEKHGALSLLALKQHDPEKILNSDVSSLLPYWCFRDEFDVSTSDWLTYQKSNQKMMVPCGLLSNIPFDVEVVTGQGSNEIVCVKPASTVGDCVATEFTVSVTGSLQPLQWHYRFESDAVFGHSDGVPFVKFTSSVDGLYRSESNPHGVIFVVNGKKIPSGSIQFKDGDRWVLSDQPPEYNPVSSNEAGIFLYFEEKLRDDEHLFDWFLHSHAELNRHKEVFNANLAPRILPSDQAMDLSLYMSDAESNYDYARFTRIAESLQSLRRLTTSPRTLETYLDSILGMCALATRT